MKKKILLFAMVLALTGQIISAQVPSYVPADGLVGYWPFNGNANDESGNGNNGTVGIGVNITSDRYGNSNSAYLFSGTGNISLTNLPTSGNSDFSISGWVKTKDQTARKGIMCWGQDTPWSSTYFFINSTGHLQFDFAYNAGASTLLVVNDDNWHLVSVTCANGLIKLFLDGMQNGNSIQMSPNINGGNKSIGSNIDNSGQRNFLGLIDDIGVWNRALTQQEITAMYNGVEYSDTCNAVSGSLTNGLVGYWPFCGNANDDSGHGNNGTVNGATLTTDRFGNTNSAYNFDGISNFINVSNIAIQGNTSRSTSFWFKTNSTTGGMVIASGSGTNQNGGTYNLRILDEGFLSFMGGNFTSCCYDINPVTGNNLKDNNWHNCVATYDSNTFRFYIDGNLISTTNLVVSTNGQFNYFGKSNDANTINSGFFNGIIDDIGIWNRVLTPTEVIQLFNQNQCFTNTTVTDTLIINIGQLSYTNPIAYANNITIYPNPANKQVNISFNNITDLTGGQIKIINSLGQQVVSTQITLSGTNTTLALTTWGGAGLYFVQILNAQGIVVDVKKIILQ